MKDFIKWARREFDKPFPTAVAVSIVILAVALAVVAISAFLESISAGNYTLAALIFPGIPAAIIYAAYTGRDK